MSFFNMYQQQPSDLEKRAAADSSRLALKANNCSCKETCAVCDGIAEPECGWDVFDADSWRPVCDDCTKAIAPELVAARDFLRKTFGP